MIDFENQSNLLLHVAARTGNRSWQFRQNKSKYNLGSSQKLKSTRGPHHEKKLLSTGKHHCCKHKNH